MKKIIAGIVSFVASYGTYICIFFIAATFYCCLSCSLRRRERITRLT